MKSIGIFAEDLLQMKSVTNPKLSPDGSMVVYVQTSIKGTEKYISNLYMYNLVTSETTQWTFGEDRNTAPNWSPDGKYISFLSDRSGKKQVHIMDTRGGECQQLTDFENGCSEAIWSPCSKKLLTSTMVPEHRADPSVAAQNPSSKEAQRFERITFKWDNKGYFNGTYNQLVIVDIKTHQYSWLTEGQTNSHPSAWSPDGSKVAYMSRDPLSDDDLFTDIYLMDLGTKSSRKVTGSTGYFRDPKWSPDGTYLSFIGHHKEFAGATFSKIWLHSESDGTTRCLTEGWDVQIGDFSLGDFQIGTVDPGILWTNDSQGFYFLMSDYGNTGVYYGSIEGAMYPSILDPQHVYGLTIDPVSHKAVVAISTPTHPGDLYVYNLMTGDKEQISFVNDELLQNKILSVPESITFQSSDDLDIHGWIMRPVNFEEGKKYPLILEIHGGPHLMYGNSYVHEFQTLANEGYVIMFTNPRGSAGYGQSFANANRGDYGGMDYKDLMAAVDYVLKTYDFIDSNKLGVTGGSYGGFMTNWIIGQTNRFKAAVTQRCISNWISFYGVSDIGYHFTEGEIGGDAIHSVEKLWHHSPMKYVANIQTPLLLLHGEKDYRCPIEQSEQLFVALKRLKKEAVLLSFPDENHEVSRSGSPKMRLGHVMAIKEWFQTHI